MANPEHVALLKQGVEAWNTWRADAWLDLHGADLSHAKLCGAKLSRANLSGANLTFADLSGADLSLTNLIYANLREAHLFEAALSEANLSWANLSNAKLGNADLSQAKLIATILSGADLDGANLRGARVGWTTFGNVDLKTIAGLEQLEHSGPSTIGIDTIYKSGGDIPHVFLRGAGVPENLITFRASLTGKAFEFYSCFISYSTADQPFAERLHADLQNKGVRCWFAPHDIAGGKKIHDQIDEQIRLHEKLLLILSPSSMESQWVKIEIAKARRRELNDNRQVLFPVRLVDYESIKRWECIDGKTGSDLAEEVCQYFIPDFSNWETEQKAYRKAFDELMRGLQSKAEPPVATSEATAPTP